MSSLVLHKIGNARGRGNQPEGVTFAAKEVSPVAATELVGILDHDVEDRLEVECGAADALEYVRGRRLLFERFLRLVEEPHVLDRDHRLVGERLDELDLARRETCRL